MDSKLICSNNSISDLINWSKNGYIIILNRKQYYKLYARTEYKLSNKVIQINLSHRWESLMDDSEWPWYLIDSGCVELDKNDFLNIDFSNVIVYSM